MSLTPARNKQALSHSLLEATYSIYRVLFWVGSDRRGDFSTGEPYLKTSSSSHKFAMSTTGYAYGQFLLRLGLALPDYSLRLY
ncbi:MAG: hypothetical protein V7K40_28735 [Nostoc sp.]|uniref:hypothetical protein n=1 Tax=Nostoc sp. TaxID=1180 RepID=UPI002FFC462B